MWERCSGDFGRGRDFGRCGDFDERDRERGRRVHLRENVQQVVDADQVPVLVVAHRPLGRVVDPDVLRQYQRFGEVDQPYVGALAVVHEQQRTSDHLRTHQFSSKTTRIQCDGYAERLLSQRRGSGLLYGPAAYRPNGRSASDPFRRAFIDGTSCVPL